jgi:phenylacetate-CoA ligase
MERYLESGIKVSFDRVDKLKRTKAGKLKQFTSFIN